MTLKPLADKVVLKQTEAEEVTASGIVLAGASTQEKPLQGTVIAVGPGGIVNGEKVEMVVKEGDTVIYGRYGAHNVKIGKEEYVIVAQDAILAIVE